MSAPEQISTDEYEEVFPSALIPYMSLKDVFALRLVCKKWDEVVQEKGKFSPGMWFRLHNNPLSIETFTGLSKNFPVTQFKFDRLDLETNILGDQATFQRFTMGHCLTMSALLILECTLSTGRFFELLAFCKSLRYLAVRDSPSIFQVDNGIAIAHWSFCYKSLRSTLANLQKLSISGKSLRDVDVWGLGISARLKELQVICEQKLPMDGINKILKNSCETLKVLILRGFIPYPGLAIDPEMKMKSLYKLQLEKNYMKPDTMKKFELFLEKCPCLAALRMSSGKLEKTTLSKVAPNLTSLELWRCEYDENSFAGVQFPNLRKLSLITGMQTPEVAFRTHDALMGLSDCKACNKMPKLTSVELRLLSNGADYLRSLRISNQSQLTALTLFYCTDIAGTSLRKIFKNLTGLLSLSITKCVELIDESVCPGENKDETESLANLKTLNNLDLSGTGIGNNTITECVTKMEQLRSLKLNDNSIRVDKAGLRAIMKATETSLKSLKTVSVDKCVISREDYKTYRVLAPQLKLVCKIETSSGIV